MLPSPPLPFPPLPLPSAFDDSVRAMQAVAAEANDHLRRSLEDATVTMVYAAAATSPFEALDIWTAYQRRAWEEHLHHVAQLLVVSVRAAETTLRAYRRLLAAAS